MILSLAHQENTIALGLTTETAFYSQSFPTDFETTENLSLVSQSFLAQHNITYHKLTAIGLTIGPGSYTGLRLAVTTAKTLAYISNCPIYGINSLEALARQVATRDGIYATLIPAMTNWYNFGIFSSYNGELSRVCTDSLLTEQYLRDHVLAIEEPITLYGAMSKSLQTVLQGSHHHTPTSLCLSPETISHFVTDHLSLNTPSHFDTLVPIYPHTFA